MRTTLERRLSAIAALAGLLFPSESEAMRYRAGVGVQAGVSFFHHKPAFTLNLEAYGVGGTITRTVGASCGPAAPLATVGPMLGVNLARGGPRLIAGALGGTGLGRQWGNVGGEVGAVWGAAGDPGIGLHLGGDIGVTAGNASIESEAFRELTATAGMRVLAPYGSLGTVCVGRPRRDDAGRRLSRAATEGWARDAQTEAESVLAFLDLAQELLEHEAPPDLVAAALDSAEDEVRHALLCAAEACEIPRLDAWVPRATLGGRDGLERIASESVHDGWINEGNAARDARTRMARAEGSAQRALAIVASDEARHAVIGARIAAWAIEHRPRAL